LIVILSLQELCKCSYSAYRVAKRQERSYCSLFWHVLCNWKLE